MECAYRSSCIEQEFHKGFVIITLSYISSSYRAMKLSGFGRENPIFSLRKYLESPFEIDNVVAWWRMSQEIYKYINSPNVQ